MHDMRWKGEVIDVCMHNLCRKDGEMLHEGILYVLPETQMYT